MEEAVIVILPAEELTAADAEKPEAPPPLPTIELVATKFPEIVNALVMLIPFPPVVLLIPPEQLVKRTGPLLTNVF